MVLRGLSGQNDTSEPLNIIFLAISIIIHSSKNQIFRFKF